MADLQAQFIDVQGFLPRMSRAVLALGIVQVFRFLFFSSLFVCFYCCWEQRREGERGQWGWGDFGKLRVEKKRKPPETSKLVCIVITRDTLIRLYIWVHATH